MIMKCSNCKRRYDIWSDGRMCPGWEQCDNESQEINQASRCDRYIKDEAYEMKIYAIDVRYYIPAESEANVDKALNEMGISGNEYYGGYAIVEETESEKSQN